MRTIRGDAKPCINESYLVFWSWRPRALLRLCLEILALPLRSAHLVHPRCVSLISSPLHMRRLATNRFQTRGYISRLTPLFRRRCSPVAMQPLAADSEGEDFNLMNAKEDSPENGAVSLVKHLGSSEIFVFCLAKIDIFALNKRKDISPELIYSQASTQTLLRSSGAKCAGSPAIRLGFVACARS